MKPKIKNQKTLIHKVQLISRLFVLFLTFFFAWMMGMTQANAAILLQDGFESGNLSAWGGPVNVSVSTDRATSGTHSAKFSFWGSSPTLPDDGNRDAWAELNFDLGAVYQDLWIQYKLYIPANYDYREWTNNKFIRLWATTYDDYGKVGASTWGGSPSYFPPYLHGDWNATGGGIGEAGQAYNNFITAADRGTWMTIKIHYKPALSTSQLGTLCFWKNGIMIINNTNNVNNYFSADAAHGARYGYLLGWANTGFTQDTFMYIDDVIMATTEADLGGISAPEANVTGNSVSIVDGDATPSITDKTDFGSMNAASGSVTNTYTIQNQGTVALTVSNVTVSGTHAADFTVMTQPGASVAAGGSTTFSVKFDPSAAGLRTANLSFGNNDANENPYNFSIQGTGSSTAGNLAPSATLSVDSTNGAYTKDLAVDGIKNTTASRWVSTSTVPGHSFQMDWSSAQSISNVKVWSGAMTGAGYEINDYTVQYWNGSAWISVATVVNNTMDGYAGQYNDLSFPAISTTKLKLVISTGSAVDNYARLMEVEVYGGLPSPWVQADVGAVTPAGTASVSGGVFTSSTGSNGFHYVYQPASTNCTIIARVASLTNATDPWAKAGVMIHEGLGAGAKEAMMIVSKGNGTRFEHTQTTNHVSTPGPAGANTNVAPYWVKLVRNGTSFTGYKSTDGVNWGSAIGTISITMTGSVHIGLPVYGGSSSATATFDNLSVTTP